MSEATITGLIGPGLELDEQVYENVTSFSVDTENQLLTIVSGGIISSIDISTAVTITVTVTSGVYAITIADS